MEAEQAANDESLGGFERGLRLFAPVRQGEGLTALILLGNVFLILCAYYFIKPAREGWLSVSDLFGLSKLELKAVSGLSQAALLAVIVPVYSRLTEFSKRADLVARVNLFLAGCLVVFWLLRPGFLIGATSWIGLVFYLWAGMFAVFVVAQFWTFATDLYSEEAGRRLFPFIAIGATGGAVAGSWLAGHLSRVWALDSFTLLLLAAALLTVSVALSNWADLRSPRSEQTSVPLPVESELGAGGPFQTVLESRYLTAIACLVILFNWVSSTGESILFGAVQSALSEKAAGLGIVAGGALDDFLRNGTTAFYGDLYFWVNLIGFGLQAFVASRLLRFGGVKAILLCLPVVAALGHAAMLALPILAVIKVMKVAENSTNYSLNNTARHVLWLPVTREQIYKAKPMIDTTSARTGDAFAAITVLAGTRLLGWATPEFLVVNLVLVVAWIALAVLIVRERRRLLAQTAALA